MPADFQLKTLKAYASPPPTSTTLDVRVTETYGSLNPEWGVPSARGAVSYASPKVTPRLLAEYIQASHDYGIRFNYTYNGAISSSMALRPRFIAEALQVVEELCELGIDSITVTNVSLLLNIRNAFPELPVVVSVVSYVDTASKALWFAEKGVSRIALPEIANRDFRFLSSVSSLPCEISLQLNAKCTLTCPMRREHHEFLSTLEPVHPNTFGRFFIDNCNLIRHSKPWDILRTSFIRPEDLPIYADHGINHFKFIGREWPEEADHVRVFHTYRSMSFDGNIYELLQGFRHRDVPELRNRDLDGFLEHFIDGHPNCRTDCEVSCWYCKDYFEGLSPTERWSPRSGMLSKVKADVDGFLDAGKTLFQQMWRIVESPESPPVPTEDDESGPEAQVVTPDESPPMTGAYQGDAGNRTGTSNDEMPTSGLIDGQASRQLDPTGQHASRGDAKSELRRITDTCMQFQLVHLAVTIGLPALLAEGPKSSQQLSHKTGTDATRLGRLLTGMAWAGIITLREDGSWSLSDLGRVLLASPGEGDHVRFFGEFIYEPIRHLDEYLRGGEVPFKVAFGQSVYEHLTRDSRSREMFHSMMSKFSSHLSKLILGSNRLPETGLVIDLGGGVGSLLTGILSERQGLRGIIFDLPPLEDSALGRISAARLSQRCQFKPGDLFESIPGGGNIYLMKWILHNWMDADASRILSNCARAMTAESRLFIIERLAEGPGERISFAAEDMSMLAVTGGKERSLDEFKELIVGVGLRLVLKTDLDGTFSLLEVKRSSAVG